MEYPISIKFYWGEIEEIAYELGVDVEVAKLRVEQWAPHIEDAAVTMINEQLCSVVKFDSP